jgi:hypothetical protein
MRYRLHSPARSKLTALGVKLNEVNEVNVICVLVRLISGKAVGIYHMSLRTVVMRRIADAI